MPDKVTRLEDLEVKEVSVVDRGANLRTLLVVKNAEETPMPADAFEQAVADGQSGKENPADDPNARDDGTPAEPVEAKKPAFLEDDEDEDKKKKGKEKADAPESDPVVDAQASKASEETELIVGMDDATKAAFVETLKAMANRLGALGEAVSAAKSDTGAATSEKLLNEIVAVSQGLGRLAATDKADVITALAKGVLGESVAVQPTAMNVEQLHMTADGPMYKMPMEMALPMVAEYARQKLYQAEDALYGPDYDVGKSVLSMAAAFKALGPFMPTESGAPMEYGYAAALIEAMKQYAFNQPQGSIPAGVPDSELPAGMEKSGRKISGTNLDKLAGLLESLGALVNELTPGAATAEADAPAADISKSDDGAVAELKDKLTKVLTIAKAQHAELQALKGARPTGNAATLGEDDAPETDDRTVWPDDLNSLDDPDLQF